MKCALSRKEGIYKRSKKVLNFDVYDENMIKLIEDKKKVLYSNLKLPVPPREKAPKAGHSSKSKATTTAKSADSAINSR